MTVSPQTSHHPEAQPSGEDSAIAVLRHFAGERGKVFSEAEYQEIRRTIIEELARGARWRPFTLFTFGVVGLMLLALFLVGLLTAAGKSFGDHSLTFASVAALAVWAFFVWSYFRGLQEDALRPLDERLEELEELHRQQLISREEYEFILAGILNSRQHSRR